MCVCVCVCVCVCISYRIKRNSFQAPVMPILLYGCNT